MIKLLIDSTRELIGFCFPKDLFVKKINLVLMLTD